MTLNNYKNGFRVNFLFPNIFNTYPWIYLQWIRIILQKNHFTCFFILCFLYSLFSFLFLSFFWFLHILKWFIMIFAMTLLPFPFFFSFSPFFCSSSSSDIDPFFLFIIHHEFWYSRNQVQPRWSRAIITDDGSFR